MYLLMIGLLQLLIYYQPHHLLKKKKEIKVSLLENAIFETQRKYNIVLEILGKSDRQPDEIQYLYEYFRDHSYIKSLLENNDEENNLKQQLHLCKNMQLAEFQENEIIMKQNETSDDKLYVILEGHVSVHIKHHAQFENEEEQKNLEKKLTLLKFQTQIKEPQKLNGSKQQRQPFLRLSSVKKKSSKIIIAAPQIKLEKTNSTQNSPQFKQSYNKQSSQDSPSLFKSTFLISREVSQQQQQSQQNFSPNQSQQQQNHQQSVSQESDKQDMQLQDEDYEDIMQQQEKEQLRKEKFEFYCQYYGKPIATLKTNKEFGETALMKNGSKRNATIIAQVPTKCLVIEKKDFIYAKEFFSKEMKMKQNIIYDQFPFLNTVTAQNTQNRILKSIEEQTFKKKQIVFNEDQTGDVIYVLREGSCMIQKEVSDISHKLVEKQRKLDIITVQGPIILGEEILFGGIENNPHTKEEVMQIHGIHNETELQYYGTYIYSLQVLSMTATFYKIPLSIIGKSFFPNLLGFKNDTIKLHKRRILTIDNKIKSYQDLNSNQENDKNQIDVVNFTNSKEVYDQMTHRIIEQKNKVNSYKYQKIVEQNQRERVMSPKTLIEFSKDSKQKLQKQYEIKKNEHKFLKEKISKYSKTHKIPQGILNEMNKIKYEQQLPNIEHINKKFPEFSLFSPGSTQSGQLSYSQIKSSFFQDWKKSLPDIENSNTPSSAQYLQTEPTPRTSLQKQQSILSLTLNNTVLNSDPNQLKYQIYLKEQKQKALERFQQEKCILGADVEEMQNEIQNIKSLDFGEQANQTVLQKSLNKKIDDIKCEILRRKDSKDGNFSSQKQCNKKQKISTISPKKQSSLNQGSFYKKKLENYVQKIKKRSILPLYNEAARSSTTLITKISNHNENNNNTEQINNLINSDTKKSGFFSKNKSLQDLHLSSRQLLDNNLCIQTSFADISLNNFNQIEKLQKPEINQIRKSYNLSGDHKFVSFYKSTQSVKKGKNYLLHNSYQQPLHQPFYTEKSTIDNSDLLNNSLQQNLQNSFSTPKSVFPYYSTQKSHEKKYLNIENQQQSLQQKSVSARNFSPTQNNNHHRTLSKIKENMQYESKYYLKNSPIGKFNELNNNQKHLVSPSQNKYQTQIQENIEKIEDQIKPKFISSSRSSSPKLYQRKSDTSLEKTHWQVRLLSKKKQSQALKSKNTFQNKTQQRNNENNSNTNQNLQDFSISNQFETYMTN